MPSALKKIQSPDQEKQPSLNISRPKTEVSIDVALKKIGVLTKTSPLRIMRDFTTLAFGPGRVSFRDYVRLRLFDETHYSGCDRRSVVGQRRNRELVSNANYRHDWMGLFTDKIASSSYLAAYGLPTIPIMAIYTIVRTGASSRLVSNPNELRGFLTNEDNYPLFGKPTEGCQSLGSIGLQRYIAKTDSVETVSGELLPLGNLISDVVTHYADGYLFQKFVSPHPAIRAVCGNRLATVRIVTMAAEAAPKLFRACWKIPAGQNAADNYWRPGNLLAQIDIKTGKVVRSVSGVGLDLIQHTHHPDTHTPIVGIDVPDWQKLADIALEGAKLMRHMPLIGWDMASVSGEPVIVEMNEMPDFFLNQLVDGKGILDSEFMNFVKIQKEKAENRIKEVKREVRQL